MKYRTQIAAAVITVAVSGSAFAKTTAIEVAGIQALKVSFSDLNIEQAEGVNVLYSRIEKAAERLCGKSNSRDSISRVIETNNCVVESVEAAIESVDNDNLRAIHES